MRTVRSHAAIAVLVLFIVGCSSTATPARRSFTTIDDAVTGVQAAMKVFNERYQAGLQTEDERTKVLAGYAVFQADARLAVTLAKDPNRTEDALAVATGAAVKLLEFIATLKGAP